MIDIQKIENLTPEEISIVKSLQDEAKKARKAARLIKKTYCCFGIGKEKIELCNDGNNAEYLTYDGMWQARYLDHVYEVQCSEEEIFEYFLAEFLIEQGLVDDVKNKEKANTCKYLKKFLSETEKKYAELYTF